MKKQSLHILLAAILTFSVTDYVWIQLLKDNQAFVEVEFDSDSGEKLQEGEENGLKFDSPYLAGFPPSSPACQPFFSGFLKVGNSYVADTKKSKPKLFILHRQLKLHC
ncbi:hypothetical protein QQ020_27335 [Fulvivirgaceae bacterium BMA12]|uniref:Uncharacterized protein n=1 Tax=Agaribacillus aureus TaxID=3051825 RepID=A0ABT8LFT7_9BACT|nr:hypothetical protein [Fulvivirgaceae bacterium BMA12]